MNYRICDRCGAHLDPGEICDCQEKENAAPVRQHQNGNTESDIGKHISKAILHEIKEDCQA